MPRLVFTVFPDTHDLRQRQHQILQPVHQQAFAGVAQPLSLDHGEQLFLRHGAIAPVVAADVEREQPGDLDYCDSLLNTLYSLHLAAVRHDPESAPARHVRRQWTSRVAAPPCFRATLTRF